MLVGKASIKMDELERHSRSAEELTEYADSLVPEEFRHNLSICYNQRYLCCVHLRKSARVSWDRKKEVIDKVLAECRIVGYTDSLIEISRLYMYVDLECVMKYLGGMK